MNREKQRRIPRVLARLGKSDSRAGTNRWNSYRMNGRTKENLPRWAQKSLHAVWGAALVFLFACGSSDGGTLTLRVDGANEARRGITSEQTADGWAVEFDHAILVLAGVRLATGLGDDAGLMLDSVAIELIPQPAVAYRIEGLPAQRWDRTAYYVEPPDSETRALGVEASLLERMQSEEWSTFYSGRLIAPAGTQNADGDLITVVPFEFGFPVEATYDFCVSGNDGTDGVVIPPNSAVDYEVTWHLTHLFFDSFAEDAFLRVEPLAARWDGERPLSIDDLDVPLGGLRGTDGGPLRDQVGDPVVYIPGSTGANTLRDFVLNGRPGHFNGLEGFCTTTLRVLP